MNGVIAEKIATAMERSSWIRKMFDEGTELKKKIGAHNVFDFTLGNPVAEPPDEVMATLALLATDPEPGAHRYMSNAGLPDAREAVAEYRAAESGLPFTRSHIVMTCGAGGALNVIIKALVDPGDEVVIVAPYFAEYLFYIDNHQGKPVIAQTGADFQVSAEELERVMSDKTRLVILNSPNNPTGAVYSKEALDEVGQLLAQVSHKNGRPVYLVMDEPYKKLLYNGAVAPDVFASYPATLVATSHSKDLNLPGERIGYIAIGPENEGADLIEKALTMTNRTLGYVNAPALFQRVVAECQEVMPDMSVYAANRKILVDGLRAAGYELTAPGGGFYLFPQAPRKDMSHDEFGFIDLLRHRNILVAPGTGFGWPGFFRISFCCEPQVCRNALPGFADAAHEALQG